jgi:hypothetical protein
MVTVGASLVAMLTGDEPALWPRRIEPPVHGMGQMPQAAAPIVRCDKNRACCRAARVDLPSTAMPEPDDG